MKTHFLATMLSGLLLMGCTNQPEPVTKASACSSAPKFTDQAFVSSDCAVLPGRYWRSENPVGGIVLLHNFGDYSEAFASIGPKLRDLGYSGLAFDQRGFGDAGERGRWYGQSALVGDARDAVTLLKQDIGNKPVYILGESMGGSVALLAAAQPGATDGLILAAPGVREGIDYRWFWDAALWIGDKLVPAMDVSNPRGDGDKLTQSATARLANSDKVVTDVRIDTYAGLVDLTDASSEAAYKVQVPTLLLYGGEDDTIDAVAIENAEAALRTVTSKRYPNAPHLLFQSIFEDTILADTADWLASHQQ